MDRGSGSEVIHVPYFTVAVLRSFTTEPVSASNRRAQVAEAQVAESPRLVLRIQELVEGVPTLIWDFTLELTREGAEAVPVAGEPGSDLAPTIGSPAPPRVGAAARRRSRSRSPRR